jgi:alkanesulfonate monooxygenase SsuD/methylene tetrahydromethanopterin reductase-like flavin-dependent oxidoreductase (luciferase family)
MLRVGLAEQSVHTRYAPTALVQASYLTAVATRMDSFWLPDHLNSLFPRSVMTPKYVGTARLAPKTDACLEPWTILGHLAARNRLGRLRLGIGVTDASRRNPAVTAQAAATLHLLTRGRAILGIGTGEREGNEPYGVEWSKPVARFEEAMATIRALWNSGGDLVTRDRPTSRCTTPSSTCRRTVAGGQKSGSPPTGHGCCGPPGVTPTPGFPRSPLGPRPTPPVCKRSGPLPLTPGGTQHPSRPPIGCS